MGPPYNGPIFVYSNKGGSMITKIDLKEDVTRWFPRVPTDLLTLVGNISVHKFRFGRYYNQPNKKYYQAPIEVGPLFDTGSNTIGYRIFYRGYQVLVDNVLNEITISN